MQKNIISVLLVFSLLVSSVIPAYANSDTPLISEMIYIEETGETVSYKLLTDTDDIRVVETSDENYTYHVVYNKNERSMDVVISDAKPKNVAFSTLKDSQQSIHIDLNQANDLYNFSEDSLYEDNLIAPLATTIKQKTFTNFEYFKTIGTTNSWELRRPDPSNPLFSYYYFNTNETNQNRSYLNSFMDYVEKINSQEFVILGLITASVFSDILVGLSGISTVFSGGALTPAMVMAVAGAVTANAAVINSIVTWGSYCQYAYNYYAEAYYARA
ncbi:MAG: geobacillin-26 family protein [Oscillospiraceae bacterium]|nr:geobacillin-26 family protein [Oscillospiraceae bacterium]